MSIYSLITIAIIIVFIVWINIRNKKRRSKLSADEIAKEDQDTEEFSRNW